MLTAHIAVGRWFVAALYSLRHVRAHEHRVTASLVPEYKHRTS